MKNFKIYTNPDLHIHSTFSDGSDTPAALLENVKQAGLDLFAMTDHDCFDGCVEMTHLLSPGDPAFLTGVELSCDDGSGKCHILGYGFDTALPSVRKAVSITHRSRIEKVENRMRFLMEQKGMTFTNEDIKTILSNENPGKPHIVNMMMEKGYIHKKEEGFAILEEYHGKERRLTPVEAIGAILKAGGIPVLAHGILGDGSDNLSEAQIDSRVARLKNWGLMGLECYYSSFSPEQKECMLSLARKYNLMVTAGSDYHGKNKPVRLGETNEPESEQMMRFYQTISSIFEVG